MNAFTEVCERSTFAYMNRIWYYNDSQQQQTKGTKRGFQVGDARSIMFAERLCLNIEIFE